MEEGLEGRWGGWAGRGGGRWSLRGGRRRRGGGAGIMGGGEGEGVVVGRMGPCQLGDMPSFGWGNADTPPDKMVRSYEPEKRQADPLNTASSSCSIMKLSYDTAAAITIITNIHKPPKSSNRRNQTSSQYCTSTSRLLPLLKRQQRRPRRRLKYIIHPFPRQR